MMSKKPAKDVDAIYASFELDECNYNELSEEERYHLIKKKWLMLTAVSDSITSEKLRMNALMSEHHE